MHPQIEDSFSLLPVPEALRSWFGNDPRNIIPCEKHAHPLRLPRPGQPGSPPSRLPATMNSKFRFSEMPNAELGERIATPVCGLVRDDTVFGTFRSKAGAFGIDSFVIARP